MRSRYLRRRIEAKVRESLAAFPAVAVVGPRQCGKSTLARALIGRRKDAVYLDLERPSDRRRLAEPELFFDLHRNQLVCLDEIHRVPELFAVLRGVIDADRRPGRFLVLGSASRDLLRQSSESLAGRIAYLELTPFLLAEMPVRIRSIESLWLRGGFPESVLARSGVISSQWRRDFVRTFLERDVPQFGVRIPSGSIERLWRMCAHHHGQLLNQSRLGESLGVSHTTIRSYLELLAATFMVRLLPPLLPNLKKRLVKSPRLFVRDSGILHTLLDIETHDDLLGHPVRGASWEGWVIENVLGSLPDWRGYYYRTASGAEVDLVLEKGQRRVAIECKASAAPAVSAGFWSALEDLGVTEAWVIAPVPDRYPIGKGVEVASLPAFLEHAQTVLGRRLR